MKMHVENDVVLGNTVDRKSFTIAASAKAFQILSSGIYKHKIRAVIREVMCNANDAHIHSGVDEPWLVKAPNSLDPRFVVRDFGKGLDDEDMQTIYTQYFASTKTNCDNQTGAFGLGAKSPFSYTDTFTVASYHEGQVNIYNAMMVSGEPQLAKVYSGPFEEGDRSGIEVTVPVKVDDINKWVVEIADMLKPFKRDKYILSGTTQEVYSFERLSNYSDDWFGVTNGNYATSGVYAIFGSIVYPITQLVSTHARWLLNAHSSVMIHFPLDAPLSPQPSREELQFNDATVRALVERVNKIDTDVRERQIAELRAIKDTRALLRALKNKLTDGQFKILENANIQFDGRTIRELNAEVSWGPIEVLLERLSCYQVSPEYPTIMRVRVENKRKLKTIVLPHEIVGVKKEALYILINDMKGNKRNVTIKGLARSTDSNTPKRGDYILVMEDYQFKEWEPKLKQVMGADPINVFYMSKCEEYRKLVPNYGIKTATGQARPRSPNAVHNVWDEEKGYWKSNQLFLSTDEIAELDGYCVGYCKDMFCPKGFAFNRLTSNMFIALIKPLMRKHNITEFYEFRSGTFNRVMKNDNLLCLYKLLEEDIVEMAETAPQKLFFVDTDNSQIIRRMNSNKILKANILPKLSLVPMNDELDEYQFIMEKVRNLRTDAYLQFEKFFPDLVKVVREYEKKLQISKEYHEEAFDLFKTNNPLINRVLELTYSVDDDVANDMVKYLK